MRHRPHLVFFALLFLGSAGVFFGGEDKAAARESRHGKSREGKKKMSQPDVIVTLGGMRMERPPRVSFAVNFTLKNPLPEPRWFLLPVALPAKAGTQLSVLEEYRLPGKTHMTVGRTIGSWAYQIVKVPPKTTIKIHKLAVSHWGKPPDGPMPLSVTIASSIRIGDKPAEEFFSQDPTCTSCSDVHGDRLELSATQKAPGGQPLNVTVTDAQNLDLTLELSEK